MSRWTGHDHIDAVLRASDAWHERCFVSDGSLFSDGSLWTLGNIQDLKQRFTANPITGADRTFVEKLKVQVGDAPEAVIRLAAEIVWLLHLFPISSRYKARNEARTDQGSVGVVGV